MNSFLRFCAKWLSAIWRERKTENKTRKQVDRSTMRFKKNLLEVLPDYFFYIRKMRHADPDAYHLYSRIGAQLLAPHSEIDANALNAWWKTNRPAFGAITFMAGGKPEHDMIIPAFMYFRKYDVAPYYVQRGNSGDTYEVTAFYHDSHKTRKGLSLSFFVRVCADGTIASQRSKSIRTVPIRHRKGGVSFITRASWEYPDFLKECADRCNNTIEEHMRHLFCTLANFWAESHASMIMVSARKGSLTAKFSIDVLKTPDFFQDRDIVIGDHGKRLRIFHLVRTHARDFANGRSTYVRTHFRGVRQFAWHGYNITIDVPGRTKLDFTTVDIGSLDFDDLPDNVDAFRSKEVAKILDNYVPDETRAARTS